MTTKSNSSKASVIAATQSTSTPSSLTDDNGYIATKEDQKRRTDALEIILESEYKIPKEEIKKIVNREDKKYDMILISIDKDIWNTQSAAQMINYIHMNNNKSVGTGRISPNKS